MRGSEPSPPPRSPAATVVLYAVMLAVAVGGFLLVDRLGLGLSAPPSEASRAVGAESTARGDALFHVLLALAAMIVCGRGLAAAFRLVGQPPVIGEVVAGILLGPSLLGRVAPPAAEFLLPASVAPQLAIVAQIAIVLYMFLVGLELDAGVLRDHGGSAVAISHASIVAPFLLGSVLAIPLYPRVATADVPFTVFALFLGVSMSVTAFPVLARILTDQGLARTPLGIVALACAAADDVTAWCLLAFVVGVAQARLGGAVVSIAMTVAFIAVMLLVVRPVLRRFAPALRTLPVTQATLAATMVAVLVSALLTEGIGVHAVFGAFLLGSIIPHDSTIARELPRRLHDLVAVLLLPAFFAFTGMRTQIGLVATTEDWILCAAIVLVATLGKFGGTLAAAKLTGLPWRDAAALGLLMNTRGLMELIVLNIGLDLGVISPRLFAMLVIMALATTLLTTPLLGAIGVSRQAAAGPR